MKATHTCPKCASTQLIFLSQVADLVGEHGARLDQGLSSDVTRDQSKAWRIARLAIPRDKQSRWLINEASAGVVQAYVCRRCGLTEFYTQNPMSIPIDGEIIQEITRPKSER